VRRGATQCVGCLTDNQCNDGIACTEDACVSGTCTFTPNDLLCPDDSLFCNGTESCNAATGCISGGNPCSVGQCDEASDSCTPPNCAAPAALAVGGRAIQIAAAPGSRSVALRISGDPSDDGVACLILYVQSDGNLNSTAVFLTPAQ